MSAREPDSFLTYRDCYPRDDDSEESFAEFENALADYYLEELLNRGVKSDADGLMAFQP